MMMVRSLYLLVGVVLVASYYWRGSCDEVESLEDGFAPVIQLEQGKVRGVVQKTEDGKKVWLYQGIRYGKSTRFSKPTPADPWTGIYNATHYREACPQLPSERLFGRIMGLLSKTETISEDCLFVNVWRPVEESKKPRSVMVWIHGGAFETGTIFTQAYDGRYLAHRGDVVVVSIQYRLGAFGFLYDGSESIGNLGLWDQILGLRWVQANIHAFGGDPKKVTIFGESAGGISVGALVLSPQTKGLFTRAILQSGAQSGFYTSESKAEAVEKTKYLAKSLKCEEKKMVDCLKKKSVKEILEASKDAFLQNRLFLPVWGDEVMPLKPQIALKTGKFNKGLDLMFGVTKDEGSMFAMALFPELRSKSTILTINSTRETIVKLMKNYNQNYGEEVAQFYAEKLRNPTQDSLRSTIGQVWGDYHLICPTSLFGSHYASGSPSGNFYSYKLMTPVTVPNMTIPHWVGTFHTADLFYLFMVPLMQSSYDHYKLSLDMMEAWSSFAKTGNPGKINGVIAWEDAFEKNRKGMDVKAMILDPVEYRMEKGVFRWNCDAFWKAKIFE